MKPSEGHFYSRVFGLIAAGLLAVALYKILASFIAPILWAALLAFLLLPVNQRLRRRLKGRAGTAALLLTLAMLVALVIPSGLLMAIFAGQASELGRRVQDAAASYQIARPGDVVKLPVVGRALHWLEARVAITPAQVQDWAVSAARTLLQTLVAVTRAAFVSALGVAVDLLMTLFLLFFFLRDGEGMARSLLALVPLDAGRKERLTDHLAAVTRAVVYGALLTALVQGALVGIGFTIVRLPSPVVFGALGAMASLVPLVGTALVWAPAAGVLMIQGRWGAGIFLVAWGVIAVSGSDNVVRPLVVSGRAQIATLPVLVGLLGGIGAFGLIGMFLGPIIIALVLALLGFAAESLEGPGPPQAPSPSGTA